MDQRGTKRKKKSFVQQSMKYHKKGIYGKGVRVDEETYEYFLNLLKIMNQEFDSEEDKRAFVENVFIQLKGNEVSYSCNQVVSRVVDTLIPFVSEEVLKKFMMVFYEQIRLVCMDQFASFVLQKLIITVLDRYLSSVESNETENQEVTTNSQEKFDWLLKISKYVLNNLDEFVFKNYPNRVMRTVVGCLVGYLNPITENTRVECNKNIPKELTKHLKELADQLLIWPRLKELPLETISSGFLQVFLQCLASLYPKRVKTIGVKLLDECFASESGNVDDNDKKNVKDLTNDFCGVSPFFENEASTRSLEILIAVAPPKLFTQIYTRCFYNRLTVLACHPKANFCVQKLLQFCKEKCEFDMIFDELSPSFNNILEKGRSGVILQLCEGCFRFKSKQSIFIKVWMKYLGCDASKEARNLVSPLTIFFKQKDQYFDTNEKNVHLHGSLLLQNMLKFNKPIMVISSLLDMKADDLCFIFSNPKGSHIANAFFESEFVGEKSKDKFFKTLQGLYSSLATSKHGSRVFDIVWRWANVKNRVIIASELLENEAKLNNSQFGRPIIYYISLSTFRHNKEEWIRAQSDCDKVHKLFADIVK